MPKNPAADAAPRRVTLKTLAEHLGLSIGTISIVLNDAPGAEKLRAETRERVRKAARELGYRANEVARSLRKQRSRSIGVLMPRIQSHYANGVVTGLE
ncbi:MAG: LacI family DNA-binding transcriptional regulator, partial [Acidobacteriota bacterium]